MNFPKLHKIIANRIIDWLAAERPPYKFPLSDFNRLCYEIKPGDVILIEGRSHVSDVIKTITQSRWSHAALYIGRIHDVDDLDMRRIIQSHYQGNPDAHLIMESMLGKGTIISDLYIYKQDHVRICRPRALARQDAREVIRYALMRLGLEYDIRQILDLARYLFPWAIVPRQFRSTLFRHNAGSHTKMICSTLIAEAFGSVHFPILPDFKRDQKHGLQMAKRNPRLITPSDFDYSPYFDIIKSPPIELNSTPIYRTLPWKDQDDPFNAVNSALNYKPDQNQNDIPTHPEPSPCAPSHLSAPSQASSGLLRTLTNRMRKNDTQKSAKPYDHGEDATD